MKRKSPKKTAETLRNRAKEQFFSRNFKQAFSLFEEAAELGDAEAQCYTGEFYDDFGHGFPVDLKKALAYYKKAYAGGFARAGTQLAIAYDKGIVVKRDKAKAQELMEEAAERGEAAALCFKAFSGRDSGETYDLVARAESDPEHVKTYGRLLPLVEFFKEQEEAGSDEISGEAYERELQKLAEAIVAEGEKCALGESMYGFAGYILEGVDDEAAEMFLRKAAENGSSEDKGNLAYFLWLRGKPGAGKLALESVEIMRNIKGMLALGACYSDGTDLPQKPDEAEYWLKEALKMTEVEEQTREAGMANFWLGRVELDLRENPTAAKKYFRKAAELAFPPAVGMHGRMLFVDGLDEAFVWAKKLAELSGNKGLELLAVCYRDGVGTKQDYEKFVELARKMSESGEAIGAYMLGCAYRDGLGVPADEAQAIKYFEQAHLLGDTDAAGAIAGIYFERTPSDKRAFTWAKKGAKLGDGHAILILGCCYRDGIGTAKNDEKELDCYFRAEAFGNPAASYNLGVEFYRREAYKDAREHFLKAHEFGSTHACVMLARCEYEDEDGDDEVALKLARMAAKQGEADAYLVIGACYKFGRGGLKASEAKALEAWKKGAELGSSHCKDALKAIEEDLASEEPANEDAAVPEADKPKENATPAQSGNGVFCIECGTKNPAEAKFCFACGTRLVNREAE